MYYTIRCVLVIDVKRSWEKCNMINNFGLLIFVSIQNSCSHPNLSNGNMIQPQKWVHVFNKSVPIGHSCRMSGGKKIKTTFVYFLLLSPHPTSHQSSNLIQSNNLKTINYLTILFKLSLPKNRKKILR